MHTTQTCGVTVAQVILVHFVEVRILTGLPFFFAIFMAKKHKDEVFASYILSLTSAAFKLKMCFMHRRCASYFAACRKMLHYLHQSHIFKLGTMPQNASLSPPVTHFQTWHDAAKCFIISTGHAFSDLARCRKANAAEVWFQYSFHKAA